MPHVETLDTLRGVAAKSLPFKVLIAYDGSKAADAAIGDLRCAGLPSDVEAAIVTVAEVWPRLPETTFRTGAWELDNLPPAMRKARELATLAARDALDTVEAGANLLRQVFPTWRITAEHLNGSPYRKLVWEAERWRPDLVVVGSHGRGAVGELLLGSVSQAVLSHAPCSVRVARLPQRLRPVGEPVRMVLGVDGSAGSAAAVHAIAARPWIAGTQVRIVSAVDLRAAVALVAYGYGTGLPLGTLPRGAGQETPAGRAVNETVEAAAGELSKAGLRATPVLREGDPKRVLLDEAREWQADCIFLGAKGHSRLDRFLLGSVSASVAARADCSVEVVRSA